jgi:hypothetical protein
VSGAADHARVLQYFVEQSPKAVRVAAAIHEISDVNGYRDNVVSAHPVKEASWTENFAIFLGDLLQVPKDLPLS